MTELQDMTSVHHETVTKVSTGEQGELFPKRKSPSKREAVAIRQVHPTVWAEALYLCDGEWQRIRIIDETTVIIENQRVR